MSVPPLMPFALFPATAPLPPLPPPTVVLPSHTTGPVAGINKYYAVEGTPFDGVHTNWVTIGPLLRTIPGATWGGYPTYEAAHSSLVNASIAQQLVAAAMMQPTVVAPAAPPPPPAGAEPAAAAAFATHALVDALEEAAASNSPPPSPTLSSVSSSSGPTALSDHSSFVDVEVDDPITAARGSRPRGGWPYLAIARGTRTGVFPNSARAHDKYASGVTRAASRGFRTEDECRAWLDWYNERYPLVTFALIDPFEEEETSAAE
ncbi:hypothetical protein FA95DRAFT_1576814 [Auriscalpium vulgare]|uniref:Uncharacterized protein n=1 Tax=Auriscalpium vulgare TaxID=40419 RepID=A0ACB8R9U0_9AGAM|nr:hypothetical protein FA95DRAFT_1576814 [Auriscalpium vulgare]